ncbi:MAG: hypothetical protein LBT79_07075 [Elusimicrobiota bacterium]|jgi:hypothetical protein|nr:hypothetical protein [Elusimicrobiota bacterium]
MNKTLDAIRKQYKSSIDKAEINKDGVEINALDVVKDLNDIEADNIILGASYAEIFQVLDRDETYWLNNLLMYYHQKNYAQRLLNFTQLEQSQINRTALLIFITLIKDDGDIEIFNLLTQTLKIGDYEFEEER